MRGTRPFTSWLVVAAWLLLLVAYGGAQAQSGRRMPKGSGKGSASPPPAQTEQTPAPQPKTPAQNQISLLVLSDISQSLYLSVTFPERVQAWVAKRLRESSSLAVMDGESSNRSEAIKRAKASTTAFVVFLKVDETSNGPAASRDGRGSLYEVHISYYIFAPVTGKTQSSGVVYLNQRSSIIDIGRVRTAPVCYPGVRGNDLLLLEASLEVASRIMSALNVAAPPVCSRPQG